MGRDPPLSARDCGQDATEENNGKLVKLSKREQPESDPESSPEQGSVADEAATSDEECGSEEERVKIAAVDQENDPKLGTSPRSMPSGLQTQVSVLTDEY